jgi:hypothetical protein
MAGSSKILKLGIAVLIFCAVCLEPVMADAIPVHNYSAQFGSIDYTVITDKTTYRAGDVITYIFQLCLTCCDPTASFVIDHLLCLAITLDSHITDITSNAEYWLTGGGDGITGNSGFFYDAGVSMAWGFGFPPLTYPISNNAWPRGTALQVSGIISPETPPGTEVTTTSSVVINLNTVSGGDWENQYDSATDTSTVLVIPEFPCPALPAALILGLLGTVFVVRNRRE